MPTTFRERMIGYARAIASMRYPESVLVNGLQPLDDYLDANGNEQPGLRTKYIHELEKGFHAAKWQWISEQSEHNRIEMLAEAADLVYYACQIDEQQGTSSTLEDTLATLRGPSSQIRREEAETSAIAKHALRSARPDSKDHELEHIAILAAIAGLPERNPNWGGKRHTQPGRPPKA